MIDIETISAVARWYPDGVKFTKHRSKYKAVCSIFFMQPHHAFLYAMHGELTKSDMMELFKELQAIGVTHISAERKGRVVVKDIKFLLKHNRENVVSEPF